MRRRTLVALAVAGIVIVALGVTQALIPPSVERGIEGRLEESGGEASVRVSAIPALRLLLGSGSRLEIDARDVVFQAQSGEDAGPVFGRLDDFGAVSIAMDTIRVGPLALDSLSLEGSESDGYSFDARGTTDARSLAIFGASQLDIPGAGFLGLVPGDAGEEPIALDLDMELRSEDGRVVVISGRGEIAGYDTGPLAALITNAIVVRI